MDQTEDPRDQVAAMIMAAMMAESDVDDASFEAANNGGPMVRLVLADGAVIHITITRARVMNSTVPCYRGGHHCAWPACPSDCDGRLGRSR